MNKTLTMTHVFRVNVANHVIRTVEGVTESVLIRSVMEDFNHSWKTQKWTNIIERVVKNTVNETRLTNLLFSIAEFPLRRM